MLICITAAVDSCQSIPFVAIKKNLKKKKKTTHCIWLDAYNKVITTKEETPGRAGLAPSAANKQLVLITSKAGQTLPYTALQMC